MAKSLQGVGPKFPQVVVLFGATGCDGEVEGGLGMDEGQQRLRSADVACHECAINRNTRPAPRAMDTADGSYRASTDNELANHDRSASLCVR